MSSNTQFVLPYNPHNRLVCEDDLKKLLNPYISEYQNISIYRKCFVHKSYCTRKNENFVDGNANCPSNCLPLQEESNERLEFLGDALLNAVVADYLFERYPDENEGFLTRIRTKIVNGKMLAKLSKIIGLPPYILLSIQIEENQGRENHNILEDAFEAFIAAIYLDNPSDGYDKVKSWIIGIVEDNLDFSELICQNTNYKDIFLKQYQQVHGYIPKFYEQDIEIRNHVKTYVMCLKDNTGNVLSVGRGGTKKDAENDAAHKALQQSSLCV